MPKVKVWRKVLYEHQNLPDNYVDDSFLDELKRNSLLLEARREKNETFLYKFFYFFSSVNVHEYEYWNVVYQTGSIVQAFSRVIWLVVVFVELTAGHLEPFFLLSMCMATLFICYLVYVLLLRSQTTLTAILYNCRSLLLVLIFSYIFSPVIQTLTSTISSDTIYCMTFLTMIAHLIVRNYGVANAPIVSDVLSFNAAIFGATCLSSRLATPLHCFGFIVFAVGLFALEPELGNVLKERSQVAEISHTLFHILLSAILLWRVSHLFSSLYLAILILVMFVCPALLVAMQPLKSTISGPWDEAVLDEEALSKKSTTSLPESSKRK